MLKEFFGIGGYTRPAEGAYSWQHLTFVGCLLAAALGLAIWLGCRNQRWNLRTQNRALVWAALLMDGLELIKIGLSCYESTLDGEAWHAGLRTVLPLFLCSIQLIVIPLAAFTNVVSGLTHSIAAFASLYVIITGLARLQRRSLWGALTLLFGFCGAAMVANALLDYNYMFLRSHDGTPYQIIYDAVGGNPILYPAAVIGLFVVYMGSFYGVAALVRHKKRAKVTV